MGLPRLESRRACDVFRKSKAFELQPFRIPSADIKPGRSYEGLKIRTHRIEASLSYRQPLEFAEQIGGHCSPRPRNRESAQRIEGLHRNRFDGPIRNDQPLGSFKRLGCKMHARSRGGERGRHHGSPSTLQHGGTNLEMSCLLGWETIEVTVCQNSRANTPLQSPSIQFSA
jgi:hypothetical protein